jgi:hypothetical protein
VVLSVTGRFFFSTTLQKVELKFGLSSVLRQLFAQIVMAFQKEGSTSK